MEDAAAGCAAGLVAAGITHPLDTLKARRITNVAGLTGLYRGFSTVAALGTVGNGLYFGAYEAAFERLQREGVPLAPFWGGIAANTVTLAVWVPQDVLKERQQVLTSDPRYRTGISALRATVGEHGVVAGLYRGYTTSFLLYTPMCAIYFLLYEHYKEAVAGWRFNGNQAGLTLPYYALGGLYAGGVAAFVTTPLDVFKVRWQVGQDVSFAQLIKERSLMKGAGYRVASVAPNYALTIALWEECR
eukprot:gene18228-28087_t